MEDLVRVMGVNGQHDTSDFLKVIVDKTSPPLNIFLCSGNAEGAVRLTIRDRGSVRNNEIILPVNANEQDALSVGVGRADFLLQGHADDFRRMSELAGGNIANVDDIFVLSV